MGVKLLVIAHTHAVFAGDAGVGEVQWPSAAYLVEAIIVAPSTCRKSSLQVHAHHGVANPTVGLGVQALALALDTDQAWLACIRPFVLGAC